MKRSLLLSAAVAGLLFASCKKSSNNPYNSSSPTPTMSYRLIATNTSYTVNRTTSVANVVWTSGFAYPDVVTFTAKENNVQVQFKSTNTEQIDLMSSVALDFGDFTLPAGTYAETSLKLDLDKRHDDSAVLQLNGEVTSGGLTLPVMLTVNESIELQTEQDSVTITNDSSFVAVTTLDLSSITSGITAAMLLNAQLTSGTIVISSASNRDLYRTILNNLGDERQHCEFEHHHH